jgi:phosphoribosyl 1,2-cyclic phosphodiesterase
MKIRFRGVRGSFPVASTACRRYGGNTPCVEVTTAESTILIDAGSGIRQAGKSLCAKGVKRIHLLMSHTHWDHIQGLPHFAPLYCPDTHITFYSLHRHDGLDAVLAGQQASPFTSLPLDQVAARLDFVTIEEGRQIKIGSSQITSRRLNHPDITSGYRIVSDGAVFSYISDTDLYGEQLHCSDVQINSDAEKELYLGQLRQAACQLAADSDLMVCDTFFLPEEYKPDYGHSRPDDALRLGMEADARAIALFHHAPHYDDEILDDMLRHYRAQAPAGLDLISAREDLEITL